MTTATLARVAALKEAGEDHEWYPTTREIVRKVAADIRGSHSSHITLLDIGAGDGRVLEWIEEELKDAEHDYLSVSVDKFAIEKASTHIANMPQDIAIVGTDFTEQTLVDKNFNVAFCNPPYSVFADWMHRILHECPTPVIYFVVPRRWRDSESIQEAIKQREGKIRPLGEFDFENADRSARCKVEIVRITFPDWGVSPFDTAIEEMLPELELFDKEPPKETKDPTKQVIEGGDVIPTLVSAYDAELLELQRVYREIAETNPELLKELGVTKKAIIKSLRSKIVGLKDKYWQALFEYLEEITTRLATAQRKRFLDSLRKKGNIDFTTTNVTATLVWITKWASSYYDEQLVDFFKKVAEKGCVERYKRNQKVFEYGHWRYLKEDERDYKLCYQLVLHSVGGIHDESNWHSSGRNGLRTDAHNLLSDLVTVANNLGFECHERSDDYTWESRKQIVFNEDSGEILCDVRAYKNGNLHVRMSKKLTLAINIQAGKLLGWLRDSSEAKTELEPDIKAAGVDPEFVDEKFGITNRLEPSQLRICNAT